MSAPTTGAPPLPDIPTTLQYAQWKESSFDEVMTAYAKTKRAVQGAFRIHDNPS